jgi:hypothetical protein
MVVTTIDSKTWTVFDKLKTGPVGSNRARDMGTGLCLCRVYDGIIPTQGNLLLVENHNNLKKQGIQWG